jgi:hypothetical protein
MPEMRTCELCNGEYHKTLTECPHCGEPNGTVKPEVKMKVECELEAAVGRALYNLSTKRSRSIGFLIQEAVEQYITRERKAG